MEMYDKLASVVSQGSVRRGFFSPYLPIEHPDAEEFLDIATEGHPIQGLTTGITVSDDFLKKMLAGDPDARKLWAKVLQRRSEIGFPYILFSDNVNNGAPDVYKDLKLKIHASNMCSEIALPSSPEETFTCVLSSVNVAKWDEVEKTDAIETLVMFLDTVVTEFVNKTKNMPYFKRARQFAVRHRALGAGILGWHSLLQSKMLAFEGQEAAKLNLHIAKVFKERSYAASEELAKLFGEPELLKGYGRRNTTLNAIAPTKSSSFILGQVSQSIEPEFSNCYVKDLAKMKVTIKNDGSVQKLSVLTDDEKEVFKTFSEINPEAIINQAATRGKYIDQSQSVNLMLDPDTPVKDINALYLLAWRLGVKSLYYSFSMSAAQSLTRKQVTSDGCVACEL